MSADSSPEIVHTHNLITKSSDESARFGLRLSLPPDDTFAGILGPDWQKERWFLSESDRDNAIQEFRDQHPYYRLGDKPTLEIVKINRPGGN